MLPAGKAPLINKIEVLLTDNKLPWVYADGIAKQMFKVEKVDWLEREQLRKVVAALEKKFSSCTRHN